MEDKKIDINLLTSATGSKAMIPVEVKEQDFWKHYLRLINARNAHVLNDNFLLNFFEIEFLSYILAGDPDKSYFKGELATEVKNKFKMTAPALSNMKKTLVIKQFLEETGVMRGDAIPTRNIRKLQKFVKENKDALYNFNFSFKLV